MFALHFGPLPRCNNLSRKDNFQLTWDGTSVTRRLDYFFEMWPLAAMKISPIVLEICQSKLKYCQILNRTFTISQVLHNFAKAEKFRRIWSHCLGPVWPDWAIFERHSLVTKKIYKRIQNTCNLFGYFEKCQNCCGYFLGNFEDKMSTFCSVVIWSHCCVGPLKVVKQFSPSSYF